ncbi:MAG: ATP-binding protein [Caulobacteraceae bacterium]|nr:ATP-binding protein [Caulobacteraceae bacterium]
MTEQRSARADQGAARRAGVLGGSPGRLLALAERAAGLGYWRISLPDGLLFWSDEVYRIHGLDPSTFDPNTDSALSFYHPDDQATVAEAIGRAREQGEPFEFEARLTTAAGDVRQVMARGVCERGPDGALAEVVGVFQDVTERRNLEAIQRASAERLAQIIERLPAGAVHVQGGVLSLNAEIERITGYSREELPTLDVWFRVLYGDDIGKMRRRYEQARAAGFRSVVRNVIRRKDGAERVVEFRACYEAIGELWIIHDITEHKRLEDALIEAKERAEAAARFKTEFLANMSHEIRTALTAIIGFSGLLLGEAGLSANERRWTARIDEASRALLSIVNDVLDFSKLEAGSIEIASQPFDLRGLVEETAALLAGQAAGKGVALEVDVDAAPDGLVLGDADRLRQVLLNLVSNAVKFTNRGAVTVQVWREAGGADRFGFSVSDTGIGIPAQALDVVFERFAQADGSISRRFGGTGLGLAICKRLVDAMGGAIGVESKVGIGSRFWFAIDLPPAQAQAAPVEAAAAIDLGALRILVVDDAEANRDLVSTLLRAAGVEVDLAANGVEAVEAVKATAYDLVLMDVQMPVMDGVQATRVIRSLGGAAAEAPIVALSANVLAEQVASYRRAGMDAHLGKPINPAELLATIAGLTAEPGRDRRRA